MNDNILEIKDLAIHFYTEDGDVAAVNGIDLALRHGDTLGLVGETGAGKITTAKGILRLIPSPPGKIVSGKVLFDGENLLEDGKGDAENPGRQDIHDLPGPHDCPESGASGG